jgi:hypothetical protein
LVGALTWLSLRRPKCLFRRSPPNPVGALCRFSCPSSWVAMVGRLRRSGGRSSSTVWTGFRRCRFGGEAGRNNGPWSDRFQSHDVRKATTHAPVQMGPDVALLLKQNNVFFEQYVMMYLHSTCSTLRANATRWPPSRSMQPWDTDSSAHATPSSPSLIWRPDPPHTLFGEAGDSCRRGAANGLAATVP